MTLAGRRGAYLLLLKKKIVIYVYFKCFVFLYIPQPNAPTPVEWYIILENSYIKLIFDFNIFKIELDWFI